MFIVILFINLYYKKCDVGIWFIVFIYKYILNVKIYVYIYFVVILNVSYIFGYIKKLLVCVEFEYNRNV